MNNLENSLTDLYHLEEDLCVKDVVQAVFQREHQAAADLLSAKIKCPIEEAQIHVQTMIGCFIRSVAYLVSGNIYM